MDRSFATNDPSGSKKYVQDILKLMKQNSSIQIAEITKKIGKPRGIKFSKFIDNLSGTPFSIDPHGTYLHKANSKTQTVSYDKKKRPPERSISLYSSSSNSDSDSDLADEQPKFALISEYHEVLNCLAVLQDSTCKFVAMNMEFTRKEGEEEDVVVELLQIGYKTESDGIFSRMFDVAVLEKNQQSSTSATSGLHPLQPLLSWIFENKTILIHDARMELTLLSKHFKMNWPSQFIDTQILYESHCFSTASSSTSTANDSDILFAGLDKMIGMTGLVHPSKKRMHSNMNQQKREGDGVWKRPFQKFALEYAAWDVILLLESFLILLDRVGDDNMTTKKWQDISYSTLCFLDDQSMRVGKRCNFTGPAKKIVSRGIFLDKQGGDLNKVDDDDGGDIEEVRVRLEIEDLRSILPERMMTRLAEFDLTIARDLVMDVSKTPRLFMRDKTILSFATKDDDFLLTAQELESLVSHLQIGPDNRAILEGSLHRLSCIRNLSKKVYGITIRLGRNIHGISATITDILHSEASILLLGPPGSGKSAILRDCIRILSSLPQHVVLVDTSNEIGGNGDKVHESLGYTRRMMVPTLADQERVMIEAVQNHTPDIIVVDEIGRAAEVKAASTIKLRGCRVIATAHGCDLSDLIKNPHLKGLVGGTEQVILGDAQAKKGKNGVLEKVVSKRAGQPIFDVIVQLEKNISNCLVVRIIHNVAEAVDRHLLGQGHHLQTRCLTRDGKLFVATDKSIGGFSFGAVPSSKVPIKTESDKFKAVFALSSTSASAATTDTDKPIGGFSFGATSSSAPTTKATFDTPVGGFSFGSSSTNATPSIFNSDKSTSGLALGSNSSAPTIQCSGDSSAPSCGVFGSNSSASTIQYRSDSSVSLCEVFGSSNIASQNLQRIPMSESAAVPSSFTQTAPFTLRELLPTSAHRTSPFGIHLQGKSNSGADKTIPFIGLPASQTTGFGSSSFSEPSLKRNHGFGFSFGRPSSVQSDLSSSPISNSAAANSFQFESPPNQLLSFSFERSAENSNTSASSIQFGNRSATPAFGQQPNQQGFRFGTGSTNVLSPAVNPFQFGESSSTGGSGLAFNAVSVQQIPPGRTILQSKVKGKGPKGRR